MPWWNAKHACRGVPWEKVHADCQPWGALAPVARWFASCADERAASPDVRGIAAGFLADPDRSAVAPFLDALIECGLFEPPGGSVLAALEFHHKRYDVHARRLDPAVPVGWVLAQSAVSDLSRPAVACPFPLLRPSISYVAGMATVPEWWLVFPFREPALMCRKAVGEVIYRLNSGPVRVLPVRAFSNGHNHPSLLPFVHGHAQPTPEPAAAP